MLNNNNGEKFKDLLEAAKEDGITAFLDSESFRDVVILVSTQLISGPAAPIIGSIIGAIAPRANGIYLSYKQHRFERNIKRLIEELNERVVTLENNYSKLNDEIKSEYNSKFVEMLLDNVIDERQEDKIRWNTNGFISLMNNEINENIMQIFFDTLSELTILDIDTLRMYSSLSDINWHDIEDKYGIDTYQLKLIKEKLVRFGLLSRKNDLIRDRNNDEIVEYLKKLETDSKKKKPQGVKFPNNVKKVGSSETYRITGLGQSFLINIGE